MQILFIIDYTIIDAEFEIVFGQIHTVVDISESDFRLYHPELREMFLGVTDLCSESGTEGIYIGQSTTIVFNSQLSTDREISWFFKEFFFIVDLSFFFIHRYFIDILIENSGDLEHTASTFTVAGGDQRSVDIEEASGLIEGMGGHDETVSDSGHCAYQIGSRPQMRDLPQSLRLVEFGRQGILLVISCPQNLYIIQLDIVHQHLDSLTLSRRLHELSANSITETSVAFQHLFEIPHFVTHHYLQSFQLTPVVQVYKNQSVARLRSHSSSPSSHCPSTSN